MAFTFRQLTVYQEARCFVKEVYALLDKFPVKEQYALCDQLRRAVVSIPSNVAEGMSRRSVKEQIHFLEIVYGSLMEVLCQMELSQDLGYITIEGYNQVEKRIETIAKLLSGLRSSLNNKQKTLNPKL